MSDINCGTMYEWNQLEMKNKLPLSEQEIDKELTNVGAWFSSNLKVNYYMLLNRDFNDYTVFNFISQNFYKGIQELKEVLQSRGLILNICYSHENDYYEFWVKNQDDGNGYVYLFFPCNDFIIEI